MSIAKLPVALLSQIPKEELSEFKDSFNACWVVRKELADYYEKMVNVLVKDSESKDWYSHPELVSRHVDSIGERRALRKVIKLLREGIQDGE